MEDRLKEQNKNEIEYILGLLDKITYDEGLFRQNFDDGNYVFGIIGGGDNFAPLAMMSQYRTLYDTVMDMDAKIKLSIGYAIKYAYSEELMDNFSLIEKGGETEFLSFYFVENALFRVESLWDMLAQFYRLYYSVEVDNKGVNYYKFFNPNSPRAVKFKDKAKEIREYLDQSDNTEVEGMWEGNHSFVNECRDMMIHRNSPNVSTWSDYAFHMKSHPVFMIKRIVEDYYVVSDLLLEIVGISNSEISSEVRELLYINNKA